jgi:hypothetical protein
MMDNCSTTLIKCTLILDNKAAPGLVVRWERVGRVPLRGVKLEARIP